MLNRQGFTLIEILMVVIMIGLLLLFAPIGQPLYQKNQIKIISDKLKSAIQYGRNMAPAQGNFLILRPWDGLDWSNGIALFLSDKTHVPTAEKIIQVWQWAPNGMQIRWQGFQSKNYILFSPALKNASCNGHFSFLIKGHEQEKIIINRFCFAHSEFGN